MSIHTSCIIHIHITRHPLRLVVEGVGRTGGGACRVDKNVERGKIFRGGLVLRLLGIVLFDVDTQCVLEPCHTLQMLRCRLMSHHAPSHPCVTLIAVHHKI